MIRVSLEEKLSVRCPRCGAGKGKPCGTWLPNERRRRVQIRNTHRERREAFISHPPKCRDQLTETQANVLAFIIAYTEARGYPPTLRDIGGRFGWRSTNSIREHINRLVRKGCLERDRGVQRGIRVVRERVAVIGVAKCRSGR